jgi:hypothetical protein
MPPLHTLHFATGEIGINTEGRDEWTIDASAREYTLTMMFPRPHRHMRAVMRHRNIGWQGQGYRHHAESVHASRCPVNVRNQASLHNLQEPNNVLGAP